MKDGSLHEPNSRAHGIEPGAAVGGLVLIVLGVFFWLQGWDQVDIVDLVPYWPVILIISGLANLFGARRRLRKGLSLAVVGGAFLLYNLDYADWPIFLVAAGVAVLLKGLLEDRRWCQGSDRHA